MFVTTGAVTHRQNRAVHRGGLPSVLQDAAVQRFHFGPRRGLVLAFCLLFAGLSGGLVGGCAVSSPVPLPSLDREDAERLSAAQKKAEMKALVETGSVHEASAVKAIEKR